MYGKTIKIYLPDGRPTGFKQVEIANWSGQALSFPRNRLSELTHWEPEAKKTGVYFLFEKGSFKTKNSVYIGESEDVMERLIQHNRNETGKDFWSEAVILTSRDQNLTKGHIQYLEAKLIKMAIDMDGYDVKNSRTPIRNNLPRSDIASMDEFIDNIRIILGSLGHQLLEDVFSGDEKIEKKSQPIKAPKNEVAMSGELYIKRETKGSDGEKVRIEGRTRIVDGAYILEKGSVGYMGFGKSANDSIVKMKKKILSEVKHEVDGNRFITLEDIPFNSLSQSGTFLIGVATNGLSQWKYSDGVSYKEREKEEIERNKHISNNTNEDFL